MIIINNKFKRRIDDWVEKGINIRYKYINASFKFIYRVLKKFFANILLFLFCILGIVFYKAILNKSHK